MLNGKPLHLGYFKTEEDAKQAYQDAKLIHHIIEHDSEYYHLLSFLVELLNLLDS